MSRRTLARYRLTGPSRFARTSPEGGGGTGTSDNGQGQSGDGGDGSQSAGDGTGGGSSSSAGGTGQPEAKFTQADLDRIISDRLAAEKAKHQKELEDAQALAGKNETERLTLERDNANARATEVQQKAAERVARTEAKVVAQSLDARSDRLDAILKQADLSKAVKDDGEVDDAAVRAAVEAVLKDYPEWKKSATSSQSGGELNGGGSNKPTFTRKQIEDMSDEERVRRIDEINEAIADGRVTG